MDKEDATVLNIKKDLQSMLSLFNEFEELKEKQKQQANEDQLNEEKIEDEQPVIIKQEEIERLRLENKRLKARCELLESGNDSDVTRRIDDAVDQAHQIELFNVKISEFRQREAKIIETLGKKALELRKAFAKLTGYSVYACKDLIYKVKSEFAKGKEDKLVFQVSPHGKIKLLESKYSNRFSKLIETYLTGNGDEGEDNFPPFLASITLELFNSVVRNNATTSEDMEITMRPR